MIQRIQTVYLFIMALLSSLLIPGSILNFTDKTGSAIRVSFNTVVRDNTVKATEIIEKLLPLSLLIVLIMVISLSTIFFFKNRKIQIQLSRFLIFLAAILVVAIIHICLRIVTKFDASIIPGLKMILPVLILITSVLAFRGIKKDDRLVKSYDRLR
ncbi:MAG: DUF4293 domain-containing protein [Bacteroidales bacterium]